MKRIQRFLSRWADAQLLLEALAAALVVLFGVLALLR
jgi:hypothetical protein